MIEGCSSRIPDPDPEIFYPSRIPDPESRGQKGTQIQDPRSATLLSFIPILDFFKLFLGM
jgi:hypothetical protein